MLEDMFGSYLIKMFNIHKCMRDSKKTAPMFWFVMVYRPSIPMGWSLTFPVSQAMQILLQHITGLLNLCRKCGRFIHQKGLLLTRHHARPSTMKNGSLEASRYVPCLKRAPENSVGVGNSKSAPCDGPIPFLCEVFAPQIFFWVSESEPDISSAAWPRRQGRRGFSPQAPSL